MDTSKEITIDKLKQIQVEMLKKIDNFCKLKRIKYFVAYGTLIGAIRHNGYIPWDDDIDIMMLREDYEIFMQEFNGFYEDLSFIAPELDLNYYAPYGNVYDNRTLLVEDHLTHRDVEIGIKIDVFPLDKVPEDDESFEKLAKKCKMYARILNIKNRKINECSGKILLKLLLGKLLCLPFSFSSVQKKLLMLSSYANNYSDGKYRACLVFPKKFSEVYVKDTCSHKFENCEVQVPIGYDQILTIEFGDYMKLPPEGERVTHHDFRAFWKV